MTLLAALLALALIAAACGNDDDTTTQESTPEATEEATEGATEEATEDATEEATSEPSDEVAAGCEATVEGTEVTYGVFAPTRAMEPTVSSGSLVGGDQLIAFYDQLVEFDYETGTYSPRVAESLEPNEDFTEWTLVLPEGLTYSNGDPYDIDNLFTHLDRFLGEQSLNTARSVLGVIEEKEKVDDQTAVFRLNIPWASFPSVFEDETGMVINTNIIPEDPDEFAAFSQEPPPEAGIGAYTVERNVPGEELVLTAREDYWAGPVCIETLRFVFVPGSSATLEAYQNGDIDIAFLREGAAIQDAEDAGDEVSFNDLQNGGGVVLINNAEGSAGEDPRLREAIILALDESVINERVYGGAGLSTRSLIHPDSEFWTDNTEAAPSDPERAAEIVAELQAEGVDTTIRYVASDRPPAPDLAITVEAMLENAGFDVEVIGPLPTSDQIARIQTGDFDLANWGYSGGKGTMFLACRQNFHSESPSNRIQFLDDEMDAAIDELYAAATLEEQQAALEKINNIYVNENVSFTFQAVDEAIIVRPNIQGVKQGGAGTILRFDEAYIVE